jgi:hypothetical protein
VLDGGQCHTPAALSGGMTWYPLDRRPGGSQGQSGQVGIISFSPVFDPWTVQPVASHYTNYTISVHSAVYGGSQTSPPGKNPSTHSTGGLVGHIAGMNILEKREICCPCRVYSMQPSHYANYLYIILTPKHF